MPYFDLPNSLGRWLTFIKIASYSSPKKSAGRNLCNPLKNGILTKTCLEKTFIPQPVSGQLSLRIKDLNLFAILEA